MNASNDEEVLRAMRSFLSSRAATIVAKHSEDEESSSSDTARVMGFPFEDLSVALQEKLGENATENLPTTLREKNIPYQVWGKSRTRLWKVISGVRILAESPLSY